MKKINSFDLKNKIVIKTESNLWQQKLIKSAIISQYFVVNLRLGLFCISPFFSNVVLLKWRIFKNSNDENKNKNAKKLNQAIYVVHRDTSDARNLKFKFKFNNACIFCLSLFFFLNFNLNLSVFSFLRHTYMWFYR